MFIKAKLMKSDGNIKFNTNTLLDSLNPGFFILA